MKTKNKAKRRTKKAEDKGDKIIKEYIAFGNKKKVFYRITFATIAISLIGIPIFLKDDYFLKCFLIIWILQLIYIWLYLKYKRRTKSYNK